MRLIDFDHPERNLFKVVNQWRVEEYKNKRCDMVVKMCIRDSLNTMIC